MGLLAIWCSCGFVAYAGWMSKVPRGTDVTYEGWKGWCWRTEAGVGGENGGMAGSSPCGLGKPLFEDGHLIWSCCFSARSTQVLAFAHTAAISVLKPYYLFPSSALFS